MFDIVNVMTIFRTNVFMCVMSWNIEMTMIVISDDVLYCIVWIFWWTRIFEVYNIYCVKCNYNSIIV